MKFVEGCIVMFKFLVFRVGYICVDEKGMKTSYLSVVSGVYGFSYFNTAIENGDSG